MKDSRFSILLIGGRELTRYVLHHLIDSKWPISGVIAPSRADTADRVGYVPMDDICSQEDIPLIRTSDINNDRTLKQIIELGPDVALCCGWTQIISESVLDIPEKGVFGVHASSLPEDRGGAPVNWQIIRGDDEVGVSLFEFVSEIDHGDILEQTTVSVDQRDDISTVYDKMITATLDLLQDGLVQLNTDGRDTISQSFENATYNPQRKPKDGLIDWERSPEFQWNWIRAQTHPYPGAFTFYRERKLIIWDATIPDYQITSGDPGEILAVEYGQGIDVQTGDGVIRLKRVQFEESSSMWADDAAERYELTVGKILGHPIHFPDWLYTGIRDAEGGFQYETNVSPGESTAIQAVACSHDSSQNIQLEATFNGKVVLAKTATVNGWFSEPIEIQPTGGSHTLRVVFKIDSKSEDDIRFLKIYSPIE